MNRRLAAVGAAAAVIVAVTVAGSSTGQRQTSETPNGGRRVVTPTQGGAITITARVPQPGAGSGPGDSAIAGDIVSEGGQVWSTTYADYLFRIDPSSSRVAFREHIAGLTAIAAGDGAIWVLTARGRSNGRLLAIDPVTGRVLRTFRLSRLCGQVLYAGSQLWLACGRLAVDFVRLDPTSGRVLASTGTVYGVTSDAASPDGIWYVGNSGVAGFLGTGARLRWVRVNDSAVPVSLVNTNSLLYARGALWAFTNDESLSKIDPATGRIVKVYSSQTFDPTDTLGLNFLAIGLNSLWFLADYRYEATAVLRVSMTTWRPEGRVTGVGSCLEPCWQIYAAGGSVWVPTQTRITRIDPVRRERRGR